LWVKVGTAAKRHGQVHDEKSSTTDSRGASLSKARAGSRPAPSVHAGLTQLATCPPGNLHAVTTAVKGCRRGNRSPRLPDAVTVCLLNSSAPVGSRCRCPGMPAAAARLLQKARLPNHWSTQDGLRQTRPDLGEPSCGSSIGLLGAPALRGPCCPRHLDSALALQPPSLARPMVLDHGPPVPRGRLAAARPVGATFFLAIPLVSTVLQHVASIAIAMRRQPDR